MSLHNREEFDVPPEMPSAGEWNEKEYEDPTGRGDWEETEGL